MLIDYDALVPARTRRSRVPRLGSARLPLPKAVRRPPPEQVWESLTSDASIAAWGNPAVKEVTWTSPRPFGIGTTREVAGLVTRSRERYFRWDEGHGYSFAVYESTVPLFKRFAEDYVVEPDDGGTLFNWTLAIEPKVALAFPFKALAPVLKAGFGRIRSDGQRYFAKRT
jgi:hypothetical protein